MNKHESIQHKINNSLAGILFAATILEDELPLTKKSKNGFEVIRKECDNIQIAAKSINDLREMD